jgi:hypothetical protein
MLATVIKFLDFSSLETDHRAVVNTKAFETEQRSPGARKKSADSYPST